MYQAFFGLTQRPFSKTPDPAFLFEGRQHGEALARLELASEDREIFLLTGEVGAGKTTVSRALIDRLPESFRVVLLINPRMSAAQVLALVAERLGVNPLPRGKAKLLDALTARLFELHQAGCKPLIIIDEAHLIPSKAVFEELRLLTNVQLDDTALVSLLLIGQPELRTKLAKKTLESFAQRVGMAFHLEPLDVDEVGAYIVHRLGVAGRRAPLFSATAVAAIAASSGGVPRRINTICQSAMLVAFGDGRDTIDEAVIDDVLTDLEKHLGPMFKRAGAA